MTDELIATLSRIRNLGVIARTSVIRYKRLTKPIAEIGKELNVGTVLEGSVRVAGKKLRITAQLIDVGTEELFGPMSMTANSKTPSQSRATSRKESQRR